MNKMQFGRLAAMGIAFAFVAPLAAYVFTFGWHLTDNHQRWSEFGSFVAGIYAPIVALATLLVLLMQVALQRAINTHQFDQAHIQQARADIEFYVIRLAETMGNRLAVGNTVRELLHAQFQPSTGEELDSPQLKLLAHQIDQEAPRVMGLLFGILPVLVGLRSTKDKTFEMNHTSALQKMIAMLSFETCVALENYHRARTEGRAGSPYHFSPLLRYNP